MKLQSFYQKFILFVLLVLSPLSAYSSEQLMSLDDFQLDFSSLVGKTVKVDGVVGIFFGNMFVLHKSPYDTHGVYIDISKTPREQRKQALRNCSDMLKERCHISVIGVAREVMNSPGIFATQLGF